MSNIAVWKAVQTENRHYHLEKVSLPQKPGSLNAVSSQVPGGVYTTLRTYQGNKILPLDYQIERLENSARRLNIPLRLDEEMFLGILKQVLAGKKTQESRLRLSVDLEQEPGALYVALEPLKTPTAEEYACGVWAVTCLCQRQLPEAKQTSFIHTQQQVLSTLPPGAHEALLVDARGAILEGLSSNFFAVRGDELWTPGESVLPGITRALVLTAASRSGIPVRYENVLVSQIPQIDEAFITSSSRSVLPLRKIDRYPVGENVLRPITQILAKSFWQELNSRLVEV